MKLNTSTLYFTDPRSHTTPPGGLHGVSVTSAQAPYGAETHINNDTGGGTQISMAKEHTGLWF